MDMRLISLTKMGTKRKECKRHKWRVGSGNGGFIDGKFKALSLNIWCEKCHKKIRANYFSSYELNKLTVKTNKEKVK